MWKRLVFPPDKECQPLMTQRYIHSSPHNKFQQILRAQTFLREKQPVNRHRPLFQFNGFLPEMANARNWVSYLQNTDLPRKKPINHSCNVQLIY